MVIHILLESGSSESYATFEFTKCYYVVSSVCRCVSFGHTGSAQGLLLLSLYSRVTPSEFRGPGASLGLEAGSAAFKSSSYHCIMVLAPILYFFKSTISHHDHHYNTNTCSSLGPIGQPVPSAFFLWHLCSAVCDLKFATLEFQFSA